MFEKDRFDLTKERTIRDFLRRSKKGQIMPSAARPMSASSNPLGLVDLGYETYLVEDLLFSSSSDVEASIARMQTEGVILLTYKSLYYELKMMIGELGPFPDDLPDFAAQ